MEIRVDVSAYYKWDILPAGETAPPNEVSTTVEYQGETRTAVRRLVREPNHTDINVPDDSLATMFADHQTTGGQMTRNQFLARHLEDAVMANHAPSAHWQSVTSNDADTNAHLQNWIAQFGGGQTAEAPALSVVPPVAQPEPAPEVVVAPVTETPA